MAKHIFKKNGPPDVVPMQVGHHWVNLSAKTTYISVGTSAISDWVLLNAASVMPEIKSGTVNASSFSGSPKTATVTFATAFTTSDYAVNISGVDVRIFTADSRSTTGFTINTHAALGLTGDVFWEAIENGEFI